MKRTEEKAVWLASMCVAPHVLEHRMGCKFNREGLALVSDDSVVCVL